MRLPEEEQFSAYGFDYADVGRCGSICGCMRRSVWGCWSGGGCCWRMRVRRVAVKRFPVLGAYELALKCSQLFNLLDARGAISVTERVGVMARIRTLVVGVAKMYAAQGTCRAG